ncbi:hypothetical protein [Mucilaginibacter lappiensis]|uniref:Uncharacterized protein n=1 Tax=Mucilaginibacter lappiensis TaxID=354630 RepID=A0A1N6UVC6_9SPHI|nr:hypothetical protein [Mucilaginibacter lappiensis]MBB6108964.1 hypothetical protein [Mucilaginibacter lappiensis]MBB6130557.1 hypothetical protein [Mucilaginibacter lappiensis]SIQ69615.1 hypothetical protein SAMN05421821_103197 [Mucilaginibacter lappiensis]
MKKLKCEAFGVWGASKKLVEFVNENNILKEDVLKIIYTANGGLLLFYYTTE